MTKKGQVSTEYLVILAVVLVVALIVVALIGGMSPVSTGISESQSKNYWLSVSPISISAWNYHGTSLDLTLQNMDGQKITVSQISIGGSAVYSVNTSFAVGETRTVTATLANCGSSGDSFELQNVSITYMKDGISALLEKGDKTIVGKCS